MFRIGDRVLHIEYPNVWGRIVAKTKKDYGAQYVLVLWDESVGQSRHHPSALRYAPSLRKQNVII